MRMIFSLVGVIVTLAIIAVLMKTQLQPSTPAAPQTNATNPAIPEGITVPQVNAGNARQVQEQFKQDLEKALQAAPREIPE